MQKKSRLEWSVGVRIQVRQATCQQCGTVHTVRVAEHADGSKVRLDPCPTCGKTTRVTLNCDDIDAAGTLR